MHLLLSLCLLNTTQTIEIVNTVIYLEIINRESLNFNIKKLNINSFLQIIPSGVNGVLVLLI